MNVQSRQPNSVSQAFLNGHAEMASLREAFDKALTDLAQGDARIVGLSADLASSAALKGFSQHAGARYIEVGIAEQNLVTVAAGLARLGFIPFAASYAAFSPGRNWEQIRTAICLNNQPVKIIGSHAGLNVGADGASHQMLEDITLMRVLPNMVVLAPGDAIEAAAFARLMAQDDRPNYIRLPRVSLPTYNLKRNRFAIGQAYNLRHDNGAVAALISTGSMTGQALRAAERLSRRGLGCEVIHVPTIAPLDEQTILETAGRVDVVVTIEEHQVSGGLGDAVAALLLESGVQPSHFARIGIKGEFGQSGTAGELWNAYGLSVDAIAERVTHLVAT